MTNIFKKFALLGVLVCLSLYAAATPEAEYKKLEKTWTLHADGSQEFRCNMELTLYTHAAMNDTYGESFIVYNPQYQELKINASYTKMNDGTIVKTPDNAFVEVLPASAANAPAYNQLKEMVVVHTGLDLGATIYLDYTILSKAGYLPELDIYEVLPQESPIREYTLTANVPSGKTLSYTLANNKTKASVKSENGMQSTTWKLRNLPAISPASHVSVAQGDIAYLAATTYAAPAEALKALLGEFKANANVKEMVAKAIEGKKCNCKKIQAILGYLNSHVDSNNLTLEETGYRVRPAAEVLASAFGTEAEKTNVLAAMLKEAGMDAKVMASYSVKADKGLARKAIDHLYVAVDNKYLLNVNSTLRPQNVLFGTAPLYNMESGELVSDFAAKAYQIASEQTLAFNGLEVVTKAHNKVGEALIPYFTKGEKEEEAKTVLKVENGYATLVLNEVAEGFGHTSYGKLNSRRDVNLLLPRLVDEVYTYTIECPANLNLATPQSVKNIRNAAGELTIAVEKDGKKAVVTRSLKLNKQLYTPAEYKNVRALLTTWSDVNGKTLVFEVNE